MSKLSVWDIGRQAKMAGTTTVQTFNPADLTVRVRNNAVRMLRRGSVEGHGQGARIVEMLVERYKVSPIRTWGSSDYGAVFLPEGFDGVKREAYDELMALCKAGFSAWMLEGPPEHMHQWRASDHKGDMEDLLMLRDGEILTKANTIYFYSMQKQALQCIQDNRTDEAKAKLEEIVDYLYTNEPIHITTFQY
jgi:hypothetical protein